MQIIKLEITGSGCQKSIKMFPEENALVSNTEKAMIHFFLNSKLLLSLIFHGHPWINNEGKNDLSCSLD